jgi:two-component sensor histidine kinase
MGQYLETGLAVAFEGNDLEMGRKAAAMARSQVRHFDPSLALVFMSPDLDPDAVNRGVLEILDGCPTIGTSTAGEICNGSVTNSVVVAIVASKHMRIRVGMGRRVCTDFREAVRQALGQAGVLDYFDSGHPFHRITSISAPGMLGVSSTLMIVFSPGATKSHPSLSHDIHTYLRKYSANRIPIFGGSSGDNLRFESNFQMVNDSVCSDSIALAFIESEVMFGLGLAHGFSPTTRGALVTRASDHIVYELDGRPAAEVCAEILGVSVDPPEQQVFAFSRFPFGSSDVYGNSILQVPERVLEDGAVQFAPLMNTDQVITLMSGTEGEIAQAGLSAYKKAVQQGRLIKPAIAFMLSCALRKRLMTDVRKELEPIRNYTDIPLCGFYTYGEKGLSDDGLPVYCNQSVSMLVFSDELNPVAALVNKGTAAYEELLERIEKKEGQIKAIGRINQAIEDSLDVGQLLRRLTNELAQLPPWVEAATYLPASVAGTFLLSGASHESAFPRELTGEDFGQDFFPAWMERKGERVGLMLLKSRAQTLPEEEDLSLVQTVARMTVSRLRRLELDGRLDLKIQHLAILNRLGKELSTAANCHSPSQHMLTYLKSVLNLRFCSLWLVDHRSQVLVKETFLSDPFQRRDAVIKENDERIAKWQVNAGRPLFFSPSVGGGQIDLISPFPFSFVSIPVESAGKVRGVLNFYLGDEQEGPLKPDRAPETMDLLVSLSAQIAVFLENLSLQRHSTLYKEVHHRIKNNLHNIAGLMRMQIRRLDRESAEQVLAEQALKDSIARIVSIAKVHETLSQADIGMIDLGDLVTRVSAFALADGQCNSMVSIDVSSSHILAPSKEATSVALIVNELVQNAVKHGLSRVGRGSLSIRLTHYDGLVTLTVEDDGPGLPYGFDPERDSNLGLTIVSDLVKEELGGEFVIQGLAGTTATVCFPLPLGREIE